MKWEFIVHEDIENRAFRIFIFQRETNIQKITFWIQLFKNKISLKNSYVKQIVLTQFASQKAIQLPLFALILKSMILKQIFSSAIGVWNEVLLKKKSDYEAKFFIENEILNWKFFNNSDFEMKIFRFGWFLKTKFFE